MKQKFALVFSAAILFSTLSPLLADDFSNNFQANLAQEPLDMLAKDLGALMGAGSFHEGKALGFPVGFDIGVHVPVVGVHEQNPILQDNKSEIAALMGQVEIGLPFKINLIARGGKIADAKIAGGGIAYGLIRSSLTGMPSLTLSALYDKMTHDLFEQKTYSANAVLSFDVPFIHPYIGGGYDNSELTPTALAFNGAPVSVSRGLKGKANGYRAEGGINLSLIPFTYINLGIGLANGENLYHVGLGARF